jgi:hypothetical protein
MRILLIILLVSTICMSTYSQSTYIPIQFKNANYKYVGASANGPNTMYAYTFHTYTKDSSINNYNYSKILTTCFDSVPSSVCDNNPYYWIAKDYVLLRNDSANRKVYFFDEQSGQDSLLYDFSLSIGDTLGGYNRSFATLILTSIDSILLGTKWHRKFNFVYPGATSSIVEGIGGLHSLFNLSNGNNGFWQKNLTCYSVDSNIIYPTTQNGQAGNCFYALSKNTYSDNVVNYSFQNNSIHVQDFKGKLSIFSLNGQIIYEQAIRSSCFNSTLDLPNGIYILKLKSSTKQVVDKILIQ